MPPQNQTRSGLDGPGLGMQSLECLLLVRVLGPCCDLTEKLGEAGPQLFSASPGAISNISNYFIQGSVS